MCATKCATRRAARRATKRAARRAAKRAAKRAARPAITGMYLVSPGSTYLGVRCRQISGECPHEHRQDRCQCIAELGNGSARRLECEQIHLQEARLGWARWTDEMG